MLAQYPLKYIKLSVVFGEDFSHDKFCMLEIKDKIEERLATF